MKRIQSWKQPFKRSTNSEGEKDWVAFFPVDNVKGFFVMANAP